MADGALSTYRKNFVALVLTCALALFPANVLMAGVVTLGFAGTGASSLAEVHRHPAQGGGPGDATSAPESSALHLRELGQEAFGRGNLASDPVAIRSLTTILFALFFAVVLLMCGLSLAHAALVPLLLGTASGPARAWARVAPRLKALAWTALQSVPLTAMGLLLFVVPGVVVAIGFAFAIPVVMSEGLAGRAALERSWALSRGCRAPIAGMLVLIVLCLALGAVVSMLAPPGPLRAVISGAVRLLTLPLPLAGLVRLYQRAVSTSAGSPRLDSSARGSPGSPVP